MVPDIELVIRLQRLDNRISELREEVAALPKHIAEIEETLESHQRKLEADHAALSANQKERKKLEGDVQVLEQKVSRLRDQMLEAKTNAQYRAFQHEIEYCENEIRKAEDRILDLMSESEPLEENLALAEGALKEEQEQVEREKAAARERTAADKRQLEQIQAEREEVAASLGSQSYSTYERIRKKWHGAALAEGTDGRCSACNIILRPQFYQDLRKADRLMTCESCGRLLYINPSADFEDQAGGQGA
jgi:predicted  nucleic acid-binding Zn-ribbon protein